MGSRSGSRPWPALAALAVIILIMLIGIIGKDLGNSPNWHKDFKIRLGLDLSSGTQVTLKAVTAKGETPPSGEMQQAVTIIANRVNGSGTTGAQVQQVGGNIINVSVPGQGSQEVVNEVSTTAQLRFRAVLLEASSATPGPAGTSAPAARSPVGNPSAVSPSVMKLFDKLNCGNPNWKKEIGYTEPMWDNPDAQTVACGTGGIKYVLDKAVVLGTDITAASAGIDTTSSGWVVNLTLNGKATAAFAKLTENQASNYYPNVNSNPGDAVLDDNAIVLDGNVASVEQTTEAIPAGQVMISNIGGQTQANELANVLNYGALPLSFTVDQTQTISPQLGHNQLTAGIIAGLIGLALVVVYSFLYYRGLGIVSVSSLAIAALLGYLSVVLLSRYQNFTLSLAGIAGLIVAIGITADSFVVFFERLRDEVREGRSLRAAVESGWTRARRTIIVSDTVSFISALLLYILAVGDVKGFAQTLGLTTLIDIVVVFGFTKPMVTLLARTRFYGQGHKWSGLDPARLGARAPWRSSLPRRSARPSASGSARTTSRGA